MLAIRGDLREQLINGANLAQFLVLFLEQCHKNFIQFNGYHAEFFDFQSCSHIGEIHRHRPVGAIG